MARGRIHRSDRHIHLHLVVSANEVGGKRRKRISKKEFTRIQKEVEALCLESYPGLCQEPVYNQTILKKTFALGGESKPSQSDQIAEAVTIAFDQCFDMEELKQNLKEI